MNSICFALFVGVIYFILGFAFYHSTLKEDAQTGGLLKINGKIYKLVEQKFEVK